MRCINESMAGRFEDILVKNELILMSGPVFVVVYVGLKRSQTNLYM